MSESPLTQVDPQSLDLLFNKDPLELTDADLLRIVEKLQADKEKMLSAPQRGEGKARADISKKEAAPAGISADDLMKKLGL